MMQESQTLNDLHPQCAVKLLKECVCAAPGYLSQVCHPNLTKEFLLEFDDNVWQFIGGVGDEQLKCCHEGLSRARVRTFLPSRFHGVGLRSWEMNCRLCLVFVSRFLYWFTRPWSWDFPWLLWETSWRCLWICYGIPGNSLLSEKCFYGIDNLKYFVNQLSIKISSKRTHNWRYNMNSQRLSVKKNTRNFSSMG